MSREARVAVIGAGPTGLAAALGLARDGIAADVYERSPHIGGLARSIDLWGHRAELGAHVIAGGDPAALALWLELVGDDAIRVPLRRAALYGSRLMPYPPTPVGVAAALGLRSLPVFAGAVHARLRRVTAGASGDGAKDAQSWVTAVYGEAAYRALMEPCLLKQWGRTGAEIDASFVRTVTETSATSPTAATFAFPRDGLSGVWLRAETRMSPFARVARSVDPESIEIAAGSVVGLRVGGEVRPYDVVISTIPLVSLLSLVGGAPPHVVAAGASLRSRNIVLVHLLVRGGTSFPYNWVLATNPRLRSGRVSDSRIWGADAAGEHIVMVECWCDDDDAIWSLDDSEVKMLVIRELSDAGLLAAASVREGNVTRLRGALPVPALGYEAHVRAVRQHFAGIRGLLSVGRHGSFAVDSTIAGMAAGLEAANAARALVRQPQVASSSMAPTAARSPA